MPLSISFGGEEIPQLSAVMAGGLIVFYQLGYGVAAFGTRPLREVIGVPFSEIFAADSAIALPLAVSAAPVVRRPLGAHRSAPGPDDR